MISVAVDNRGALVVLVLLVAAMSPIFSRAESKGNVMWCPSCCRCEVELGGQLTVDCGRCRSPDLTGEEVSRHLDSILSGERSDDHPASSTRVPAASVPQMPNQTSPPQDCNNATDPAVDCGNGTDVYDGQQMNTNPVERDKTQRQQDPTIVAAETCPENCTCLLPSNDKLIIECPHRRDDVGVTLTEELDSLLSEDQVRDRLLSLQINRTPLVEVPRSVCGLSNLTRLNLDRNRLKQFSDGCFRNLTKLRWLSASKNGIERLQDGVFDGLENLETLLLQSNGMSTIGRRVFSNISELVRLRLVNLTSNDLTVLEPWPYVRGLVSSRQSKAVILLHKNLISRFSNEIGCNFTCASQGAHLYLDISVNRIRHVTDLLHGWKMSFAEFACFLNFHDWGEPRSGVQVDVGRNPFTCDCHDFEIYAAEKFFQASKFLTDARCTNIDTGFTDEPVVRIPLIKFVCNVTNLCPPKCRCVYRPANLTLHVYCTMSFLTSLPRVLPPLPKSTVSYKLDFSANVLLKTLENRSYFANTSIADFSYSEIARMDAATWKSLMGARYVSLRGNHLETLPRQVADVDVSGTVNLADNRWRCRCEDSWMGQWLRSIADRVEEPDLVQCHTPERLRGTSIVMVTDDDFCAAHPLSVKTAVIIAVAVMVAVVLTVVFAGIAVYRLRHRLYTRWKFHPFDRDECLGEDLDYDVFLCCSAADDAAHGLRIMEEIERRGYRVCYHERDFFPGEAILDNVARSIECSKRTVCFISDNFLNSPMCAMEFDFAFHHNVALKRRKRLIVLMALDDPIRTGLLADDAAETATLRHFLRQYTYIDYTAVDWLDKLLYALPLHGLNNQREDDPENNNQREDEDVELIHDI